MLLYFNNNSGAVGARFSFLVDSRALWNMRSVCRSCGLLAWLGRFFLNKEGAGANHSPLHLAVVRRVEPGKTVYRRFVVAFWKFPFLFLYV